MRKKMLAILCMVCAVLLCCVWEQNQQAVAATTTIVVKYGGKKYKIAKNKQSSANVNGKTVKTPIPGLIIGGTNYIGTTVVNDDSLGISYRYQSKKKKITLTNDYDTTIVMTIGSKYAYVNGKKKSMGATPKLVTYVKKKKNYIMMPARFVMETFGLAYSWNNKSKCCFIKDKEETTEPEATDEPETTEQASNTGEVKAMWISYLEFGSAAKDETTFRSKMTTTFDNCVKYGMNTVFVQVRPMADAMYPSSYFPWSKYVSGSMGNDPGYDPLAIMVTMAHERGLKIQAWLNPYRVTLSGTDTSTLPANHPARIWSESENAEDNRCVLAFGGKLYFNPAKEQVRTLIVNGVKEIVQNYAVDGIHFDDYFYPSLGAQYTSNFDFAEYNTYYRNCEATGSTAMAIAPWRRENVNTLVRDVYSAVKAINPNCEFGISPAGNIDNLNSASSYYVDIAKWMSNTGYVDYICPQIYWSFKNGTCPYAATVDRWAKLKTNPNLKLYIGLAVYRAGTNIEAEWASSSDVLKRQVEYGRSVEAVNGFGFYRYDSFQGNSAKSEIANLLPILQ